MITAAAPNAAAERMMAPTLRGSVTWSSTMIDARLLQHGLQAWRRQRIGQQRRTLMHDVAPKQMVDPAAIDPFRRNRPWRRQPLADGRLGFLGQQQAAQTTVGIGQRRGHRMVAIQPDRALRRVRRMPRRIGFARPLRGDRQALRPPLTLWRTRLEIATLRSATRRPVLGLATWTRAVMTRAIVTGAIMPRLLATRRPTPVTSAGIATRPLSRSTRGLSAGSTIGTAIGGWARRSAGTAAMGRFHYSPPIVLSRAPAQSPCHAGMRIG